MIDENLHTGIFQKHVKMQARLMFHGESQASSVLAGQAYVLASGIFQNIRDSIRCQSQAYVLAGIFQNIRDSIRCQSQAYVLAGIFQNIRDSIRCQSQAYVLAGIFQNIRDSIRCQSQAYVLASIFQNSDSISKQCQSQAYVLAGIFHKNIRDSIGAKARLMFWLVYFKTSVIP
ncbi:hypothetical protein CEXT_509291 [Caerostris extrusa]|uniref:Uncharacterized protein n=1 Tax=Caerostris extrusa TaxID=172846 RepID=A0AAV4YAN0_CAEEX|nr:hypothetical protein CEXT_509291 [Caerostris extrusa]